VSSKYYVQMDKIFYLYKDEPLQDGILDHERLLDTQQGEKFMQGPYKFKGSFDFMSVIRMG